MRAVSSSRSSSASLVKMTAIFPVSTAGVKFDKLKNPLCATVDVITSATESTHSSTVVSFFASFAIHTECNSPRTKATAVMSSVSNGSTNCIPTRHASAPIKIPSLFFTLYPIFDNTASRNSGIDADDAHPAAALHGSNTTSDSSAPASKKSPTAYFPRNVTNGHIANALAFFPNLSLANARVARANAPALHSPPYRTRSVPSSTNSARGAPHNPVSSHAFPRPRPRRFGLHGRSQTIFTPIALSRSSSRSSARATLRVLPHHGGAVSRSASASPPPSSSLAPSSSALALRTDPYATSRDDGARAIEYDAHRSTSRVARAPSARSVPSEFPRASVARDVETTTAATSATTRTRSVGLFVARRIAREARGVARGCVTRAVS